jgi:glutathione S-transferase
MLTLFYWPGASSLIPHITLEEIGAPYERTLINLAKGEHKSDAYLKINPHGKVPALSVNGNVLTENVAILTYLGKQFPDARLLPQGLSEEARCIATMAWFASAVHPTFAHIIRPERFASDTAAQLNMKETARKTFWAQCEEIDGLLADEEWTMGAQYTVSDPYAFFFYGLGLRIKLPMRELAAYTAFNERMLQRPAVRRVCEREEGSLAGANAWDGPSYPDARRHGRKSQVT